MRNNGHINIQPLIECSISDAHFQLFLTSAPIKLFIQHRLLSTSGTVTFIVDQNMTSSINSNNSYNTRMHYLYAPAIRNANLRVRTAQSRIIFRHIHSLATYVSLK